MQNVVYQTTNDLAMLSRSWAPKCAASLAKRHAVSKVGNEDEDEKMIQRNDSSENTSMTEKRTVENRGVP